MSPSGVITYPPPCSYENPLIGGGEFVETSVSLCAFSQPMTRTTKRKTAIARAMTPPHYYCQGEMSWHGAVGVSRQERWDTYHVAPNCVKG